jgi:hypothetical protein
MQSLRPGALWLALLVVLAVPPAASAGGQEQTTTTASTAEPDPTAPPPPTAEERRNVLADLRKYRRETRRLRRLMGKRGRTVRPYRAVLGSRHDYHLWARRVWRLRLRAARRDFRRPPHLRAWRCIHRYEGPWNDPDPIYYGGLQMDLTFQRMYGRELLRSKGTANRWTPLEQMWVAERALRAGRGFYPWPLTARRCGLI